MSWKKKEYKRALEREQKHAGWLRSELLKAEKAPKEAKEELEALKEPARAALTTRIQRNLYGVHEKESEEDFGKTRNALGLPRNDPVSTPKDLGNVYFQEFAPVMRGELERAKEALEAKLTYTADVDPEVLTAPHDLGKKK